jgi:hypothetical protein
MRKTFSTIQIFRQGIELRTVATATIANQRMWGKKIILILFVCFSLLSNAQEIKSKGLRDTLFDFLIKKGDFAENIKTDSIILIINDVSTLNSYESQKVGIFKFGTLTTHSYFHLLIKDKGNFTIIDMRQPYENVVLLLLEHFDRNTNYSKVEVLGYLKNVTELYERNHNAVPWKLDD